MVTVEQGINKTSELINKDDARSHLHKVAICPRLLPYMDTICWVVENANITER